MINHILLKGVLLFLGGMVFMLLAVWVFNNREIMLSFGRKSLEGKFEEELAESQGRVQKRVEEKKGEVAGTFAEQVVEKVTTSIKENPVLEPLFAAKEDVERTVNTVRALPEEQRNAICTQICGQP